MAGNPWIFFGGLAAAAGVAYYMHSQGYFNQIFDAINKAIDEIKGTTPAGNGDDHNCKSNEKWDSKKKKCVAKSSNLAIAYSTPMIMGGRHRAYKVY